MIEDRKADHINISLQENICNTKNYWDDVTLVHQALPEVDFDEIDISADVFGCRLKAPVVIAAITGGFSKAREINENIARACADAGIGMGVGSQRASIFDKGLDETYNVVKDYDVPLRIGNVGAPQLINQGDGKRPLEGEDIALAMKCIGAHVMAIHLNYLQEVVQPEGDTKAAGCLDAIKSLSNYPVIAKETGAGLSRKAIEQLSEAGVIGLDVGGTSGTTFSGVEYYRAAKDGHKRKARIGKLFWDWGIPSPASLVYVEGRLPAIATGGIRSGLDVARGVALGASACGIAGSIVPHAVSGYKETLEFAESIKEELQTAMFLSGAASLKDLAESEVIVGEGLSRWI